MWDLGLDLDLAGIHSTGTYELTTVCAQDQSAGEDIWQMVRSMGVVLAQTGVCQNDTAQR
jgi:hypothetical protein